MKILLGYEVGTGVEVYLEDGQTVVTGMTQLSGKTTCLEALVTRGKITAVAFLTKRGESGFRNQREIRPYFKEQKRGELIDWQYVEAILEATMGEKMKIERSFIINCCNGSARWKVPPAKNLEDVYNNFKAAQKIASRGLDQSIYTNLAAYFEIILPQIKKYKFATKLNLRKGFNVLNLIGMEEEMQQLVIESVLSYVYEKMENVVIVIPEAHKFIPQGLKTPVKGTALRLIKEGAGIGNFMWIDTQDTTSTDKALLKQCSNWIMGYQQERNEVKNVRENIGRKKITEEDIMSLKLGHFIASLHQKIYHVYVLPAGIDPEIGRDVAMGKIPVKTVREMLRQEGGDKFVFMDDEPVSEDPGKVQLIRTHAPPEDIDPEEVVELRRTVDGLEVRCQFLQDEVNELTLKTEGIVARNKQFEEKTREAHKTIITQRKELLELQKDRDHLMQTIERQGEELSQFKAFQILLARIISPYIEIPDITEEQFKAMEKQIEDLKKIPKASRRVSSPGDTGIAWIDIWLLKLGPAEKKILIFMASRFPMKMTKAEIATGCGLTTTGGYFNGAFNKLRRNKLIIEEGKNTWKLAEVPP